MSLLKETSSDELPEEIQAVTDDSDAGQLSKSMIFDLLQNSRRREVLAYLLNKEETVTLSDLAEHIAALENDIEIRELNSDQRKRVYVGLYQTHLPKMDDTDVVDYNQARGLITISENADLLLPYLETEEHRHSRWSELYGLMSVVGASLVLGAYAGVSVISTVSVTFVSALVVSAFLIVSLVHIVASRHGSKTDTGTGSQVG
jgi:hypothetical protein